MTTRDVAVEQVGKVRGYTLSLLEGLDDADWFRQPKEGVTHIAWQVGHIASAQYYLMMVRIRGRQPEDAAMISDEFLKQFGRNSEPSPDAADYPAPGEIREVLDRVHARCLEAAQQYSDELLAEAVDPPHPAFSTKIEALSFCPLHEMVHAGQIGLLRRLIGLKSLR